MYYVSIGNMHNCDMDELDQRVKRALSLGFPIFEVGVVFVTTSKLENLFLFF